MKIIKTVLDTSHQCTLWESILKIKKIIPLNKYTSIKKFIWGVTPWFDVFFWFQATGNLIRNPAVKFQLIVIFLHPIN